MSRHRHLSAEEEQAIRLKEYQELQERKAWLWNVPEEAKDAYIALEDGAGDRIARLILEFMIAFKDAPPA